jgi:ABC-2 type transport system ATP-binding protein
MTSAIRTRNLERNFGKTKALDGIDLDVPEGAVYAVVGANGAGKTTLIKVLMNILHATSGTAETLGMDARKLSGKAFQKIGYVSENQEMPDWMTTRQMLAYYRNFYPRWDRDLEEQLLRQFDLPLDRKLKHLSRGMRMKASFASSLAYRPSLIVLDEPFSGLDPLVRDELIEVLIERAPESTIFLSSHDLAEIESFSSHVGYLENGRLLFSEEMAVLMERFREVAVIVNGPAFKPDRLPESWLQVEAADSVVRFVHSRFSGATRSEVAALFPSARDIRFDPMSLRAIFLAVAKSSRVSSKPAPIVDAAKEVEA